MRGGGRGAEGGGGAGGSEESGLPALPSTGAEPGGRGQGEEGEGCIRAAAVGELGDDGRPRRAGAVAGDVRAGVPVDPGVRVRRALAAVPAAGREWGVCLPGARVSLLGGRARRLHRPLTFARAGLEVLVFMPEDTPFINQLEAHLAGAKVFLVNGLITDCGKLVRENAERYGWFDMSTLKEPYRLEGKKTMGLELAEQFDWTLPDVILYPTGGGTGLIGMWKAFEEMERLGWVSGRRPKMIAVQAAGCAPVARAFDEGKDVSTMWQNASTLASGLRVPKPYGDRIILDIVRQSGGRVVALPDAQLFESLKDWAANEGILLSPEGAAATAAYEVLIADGFLKPSDKVVLFNTGSGNKYTDVLAESFGLAKHAHAPEEQLLT